MTNGSSIRPVPVGSRSPLLPALVAGLALGAAAGFGLGRAASAPPAPTVAATAAASPAATPAGPWVDGVGMIMPRSARRPLGTLARWQRR